MIFVGGLFGQRTGRGDLIKLSFQTACGFGTLPNLNNKTSRLPMTKITRKTKNPGKKDDTVNSLQPACI
jgi:hypothetical protein